MELLAKFEVSEPEKVWNSHSWITGFYQTTTWQNPHTDYLAEFGMSKTERTRFVKFGMFSQFTHGLLVLSNYLIIVVHVILFLTA